MGYFAAANKHPVYNALSLLGKMLEEFMEGDSDPLASPEQIRLRDDHRSRVVSQLADKRLRYTVGGRVESTGTGISAALLEGMFRARDISSVLECIERAERNCNNDPPAALDAACSMVESCCKVYIEQHARLSMPSEKTIKRLWKVVQESLGLSPASKEDDDIKRILSGLVSIVDGVGALRTKAGAAHGRGRTRYNVRARHARLAINAAHTLVFFVFETWEERAAIENVDM